MWFSMFFQAVPGNAGASDRMVCSEDRIDPGLNLSLALEVCKNVNHDTKNAGPEGRV